MTIAALTLSGVMCLLMGTTWSKKDLLNLTAKLLFFAAAILNAMALVKP